MTSSDGKKNAYNLRMAKLAMASHSLLVHCVARYSSRIETLSGLYLSTPSMSDWMTSGREAGVLETRAMARKRESVGMGEDE